MYIYYYIKYIDYRNTGNTIYPFTTEDHLEEQTAIVFLK